MTLLFGCGVDRRHSVAARLARLLLDQSAEFGRHWDQTPSPPVEHQARHCRVVHPVCGVIDLYREVLLDPPGRGSRLVTYLAEPGSESHTNLNLAIAIGHHEFDD